jgi:peptide methionine sulfoxide reductase MsrB
MDIRSRRCSKTPEAISRLTPEQFRVTQQGDTELPNTGQYLHNKEAASTSVSCLANLCLRLLTNMKSG